MCCICLVALIDGQCFHISYLLSAVLDRSRIIVSIPELSCYMHWEPADLPM